MGFDYGAGRRNREIFSSTPTPFQIIGCIILLVVVFVVIARYTGNDTAVADDQLAAEETAEEEASGREAPEVERAVNNVITGDAVLESDQPENTPPVTLPDVPGDADMPSTPLIGEDVEAAEDTFSYSTQCTEAITTSRSEIAAVKVNIDTLEVETETAAQTYINLKTSMYAAIHDLSAKREKLLSIKGTCQETGIPPG